MDVYKTLPNIEFNPDDEYVELDILPKKCPISIVIVQLNLKFALVIYKLQ